MALGLAVSLSRVVNEEGAKGSGGEISLLLHAGESIKASIARRQNVIFFMGFPSF
jgi:hypothetical protein